MERLTTYLHDFARDKIEYGGLDGYVGLLTMCGQINSHVRHLGILSDQKLIYNRVCFCFMW